MRRKYKIPDDADLKAFMACVVFTWSTPLAAPYVRIRYGL